MIVTAVDH